MRVYHFLIVSLILSCNTIKKLESKAISKVFTAKEITELKRLLYFVDESIIQQYPDAIDIPSAYHMFFKDRDTFEKIDKKGILDNQKQEQLLLINELSVSKEIWNIDSTEFKLLNSTRDIDARGRYLNDYLRKMQTSTKFLEYYCESVFFSENLNPHSDGILYQNYEHFNLTREAERLIVAIHLLTINAR